MSFENLVDSHYYSCELIVPINDGIQIIYILNGSSYKYKNYSAFDYLMEYQLTFTTG